MLLELLRVAHAVENAGRITQHAAGNVAVQFQTQVAVRHQIRDQRTLVEQVLTSACNCSSPTGALNLPACNCNAGE